MTKEKQYTMCQLAEQSHAAALEKIKKLSLNPKFVCKHCGRKANNKENLCKPVPLASKS